MARKFSLQHLLLCLLGLAGVWTVVNVLSVDYAHSEQQSELVYSIDKNAQVLDNLQGYLKTGLTLGGSAERTLTLGLEAISAQLQQQSELLGHVLQQQQQQQQPVPVPVHTVVDQENEPVVTVPVFKGEATATATAGTGDQSSVLQALFERYTEIHKRELAKGSEGKYVVVQHGAQMNNRVRLVVTGLVVGLLTDRAVLSKFQYHAALADLFDSPIDMEYAHHNGVSTAQTTAISFERIDSVMCQDLRDISAGTVSINQGPSLVSMLAQNPNHRAQLLEWFGTEDSIYRKVTEYFLKPSKPVQTLVDSFTAAHFDTADHVLGIHIRWGGDRRPQPVLDKEWAAMLECGQLITQASARNPVWFVAADTEESRQQALELFGQGRVRIVYQGSSVVRSNTVAGVQAALADLIILSKADNLLLTPESSYGEQAMVLNGKPGYYTRLEDVYVGKMPYMTYTHYHNALPTPGACMRISTSQPSVHHLAEIMQEASCYHPDMYPAWQ